ncbi:hypothetical protein SUGI_0282270 [Cryptomeria japonica]|nr:hypothetical protein SUGI_0282270 [Cryptomeria japonica]
MDLGEPKVKSLVLLRKIFKAEFLLDDLDVVVLGKARVGIPWPKDIPKLFKLGMELARKPFNLNLDNRSLEKHRWWAVKSHNNGCG